MSPNPFAYLVNKARERRLDANDSPLPPDELAAMRAVREARLPLAPAPLELPAGPAVDPAEESAQ